MPYLRGGGGGSPCRASLWKCSFQAFAETKLKAGERKGNAKLDGRAKYSRADRDSRGICSSLTHSLIHPFIHSFTHSHSFLSLPLHREVGAWK